MSSQIEICNQALSRLGAKRITSFDDDTLESQQCAAIYDIVAEQVQSQGPWPCNKFRVQLAQSSVKPSFGYAFKYQLPTNPLCLRVLRLNEDTLGDIPYQVENGYILSDEAAISILYIGLVVDTQAYDPFLKNSIVDHLVAELAYKLTGQQAMTQQAFKYAADRLEHYLNIASVQGSTDDWPSDAFINVRIEGLGTQGTGGLNGWDV